MSEATGELAGLEQPEEFPAGEVYVRVWFLPKPRVWKFAWALDGLGPIVGSAEANVVEIVGAAAITEHGPPNGPDVTGCARGRVLAHGVLSREDGKVTVTG